MFKILVPVKRVPDYEIKIKVLADGSNIQADGIKWIVNPFDEIAVEEAIRIKEARQNVEVVVVSVGLESTSEQLRTALAMGADRAVLVKAEGYVDSHVASAVLEALYRKESPTLVLMGKQSIDSDASQTGQLLAARMSIPQATFASKVVLADDWSTATVTREIDGGLETIAVSLPAVITVDLRLNEPRYPSLPGIVKAKKKQLDIVSFADLAVDATPVVKIVTMEAPGRRKGGVKVASVQELVEKLKNEAKVI